MENYETFRRKWELHVQQSYKKKLTCISFLVNYMKVHTTQKNCICGVMVSVLASSVVDYVFDPRSGQTKDYKIGICCFSTKHAVLRRKSNGIRIMCLSGATCLSTDCCFSEQALLKSNSAFWSSTTQISSSSHCKLTCSCHDIAEKLLNWR